MRYLIDTNVLSEPARPRPNGAVLRWTESQPREYLAVSTVSLGEVRARDWTFSRTAAGAPRWSSGSNV